MKKIVCSIALVVAVKGFTMAQNFGVAVDEKTAISMQQLTEDMKGKAELEITVWGKCAVVCKAEGCWMKVAKDKDETMMVRMKDHKFFLPKDIDGKNVVFTGKAIVKTTTVEMLKHYAEDEGKSKEYIGAIKEPKTELAFEATGVTVK